MFLKQFIFGLFFVGFSELATANTTCHESPGALVIAHGSHSHGPHLSDLYEPIESFSPHDDWNETVMTAVVAAKKQLNFPIELAFGMWDKASFEAGINKLAAQGVCELRIIPLFISSDSEMIDIQKYMFDVNDHLPYPIAIGKVTIPPEMKSVKFGKALDTHELVSEILTERVAEMSATPQAEGVVLVAHGPYGDFYESKWIELLKTHGKRIQEQFLKSNGKTFSDFSYLTLRDDSPGPIRNERTRLLRKKIQELNENNITPIIIPVLLSSGGIESGIFERLQGLNYKIQEKFLMPDEKMIDWIIYSAKNP
jgi:hypothetical protein